MYLLDTNVISEMRKAALGRANLGVQGWADSVDWRELYLSAVTVMEMEIGYLLKNRKDPVQAEVYRHWLHERVLPSFAGRTFAVDIEVSLRCAKLHVPVTMGYNDALIGATALVHGLTVVTRNVKDFAPMRVKVLNPWEA